MAEDNAPGQLRPLGDQRRRHRYALIGAGVLVALLGAGAGVVATPGLLRGGDQRVPPASAAATPAMQKPTEPSSAATRMVTAKNLMTTDDVPVEDRETTVPVIAKEGAGRWINEMSVCWATVGRIDLGVVNTVQRNFRYEIVDPQSAPDPGPLRNQPVIYTQALQFADAAAAKKARDVYAGWLAKCPAELEAKGYEVVRRSGLHQREVSVDGGAAQVSEVVYQRPGGVDGDNAFWESVGLTLVQDRLMVTVYLHYGEDFNVSLDQSEGDSAASATGPGRIRGGAPEDVAAGTVLASRQLLAGHPAEIRQRRRKRDRLRIAVP